MPSNCARPRSFRRTGLLAALLWSAGSASVSYLSAQQSAPKPPAAAADQRNPATAFVNVTVIPMEQERVLRNQTVVVRDGRIVTLGQVEQVRVPEGAVRIDGRGKFLMPGLGDMHVHALGRRGLLTYLANGVTTVRALHADTSDLNLRRQLVAGEKLGPHLYLAGDNSAVQGVGVSPEDLKTLDFAKIAPEMAALKAAGFEAVKFTPHEIPRVLYDSVIAAAARVGLPVVGHVPAGVGGDSIGVRSALHDHWSSIEHLTGYLEEVIGLGGKQNYRGLAGNPDTMAWMKPTFQPDPKRLKELAEMTRQAGVWNCPTVIVLLYNFRGTEDNPRDTSTRASMQARLWDFVPPIIQALRDAGAGMLLGTDAIFAYQPEYSVHRELELLVQAGLSPYQALETGTRNVAAFLGTLDSTGTVAVGKRADLVLLDANPLEDIRHSKEVAGVMLSGQWLPRTEVDNRLEALNAEAEAEKQLDNLESQAP